MKPKLISWSVRGFNDPSKSLESKVYFGNGRDIVFVCNIFVTSCSPNAYIYLFLLLKSSEIRVLLLTLILKIYFFILKEVLGT